MEPHERDELRQFVREHHVHYEVEPEEVAGEKREVVAMDVRLFATHGRAKLTSPTCPACTELRRELQSFAERIASGGEAAERTEIVPAASPALYQSPEEPDVDEVALTLRVRCDSPEHAAHEERCLREIRQRLEAVGAPRR